MTGFGRPDRPKTMIRSAVSRPGEDEGVRRAESENMSDEERQGGRKRKDSEREEMHGHDEDEDDSGRPSKTTVRTCLKCACCGALPHADVVDVITRCQRGRPFISCHILVHMCLFFLHARRIDSPAISIFQRGFRDNEENRRDRPVRPGWRDGVDTTRIPRINNRLSSVVAVG
jgi:hypothetical protein